MQELRANTQVIVPIGPFVDVTDGFTPETGVTLSGADEAEILKHGSTTVVDISAATWAAITGMDGYYGLTITTALADTEGLLTVVVQDDSVCLPVKQEFMVLSQAAWDSKYAAKDTGYMDVNVRAINNQTVTAGAAITVNAEVGASATAMDAFEDAFDGTGFGFTNCVIPTVTTVTNGVSLANGAVTDASLAGNMEIVFETDFATNYNATRNAWATNVQDVVGTGTFGLNNLSAAQVNTEVSDVLKTDTIAELSAVPAATPTFEDAIMWLYMLLRNQRVTDNTAGEDRVSNDAGTVISEATISGTATAVTRAKYGAVD